MSHSEQGQLPTSLDYLTISEYLELSDAAIEVKVSKIAVGSCKSKLNLNVPGIFYYNYS